MNTYIRKIDGRWYAFAGEKRSGQVYSIGGDTPRLEGPWVARWTDVGIKYVASGVKSRNAAYMRARRGGDYCGEG